MTSKQRKRCVSVTLKIYHPGELCVICYNTKSDNRKYQWGCFRRTRHQYNREKMTVQCFLVDCTDDPVTETRRIDNALD